MINKIKESTAIRMLKSNEDLYNEYTKWIKTAKPEYPILYWREFLKDTQSYQLTIMTKVLLNGIYRFDKKIFNF